MLLLRLNRGRSLKATLSPTEFKTHPTVKLFAAINIGIESKIPSDPFSSHFALTGVLKNTVKYKRWDFRNNIDYSLKFLISS
jgi:toxin YhaV